MAKVTKQSTRPKPSKESAWDLIEPISMPEFGLRVSLYGRSGTGKTRLACEFPKPLLLIRAEEGTHSVYDVEQVDVTPLLSHPDQLIQVCEGVQNEPDRYKTVVLDTASAFQDLVLRAIVGEDLSEQIGYGDVSRDQWGQCTMQCKDLLRRLLELAELGINLVINSQEREFNAEEERGDLLMPTVMSALSPSVAGWLNPAVDYICQTFVRKTRVKVPKKVGKKTIFKEREKIEWCLRTGPDPVYVTKFRLPRGRRLPDYIADPTYEKFMGIIRGEDDAGIDS